jgi:hypothetical protein
MEHEARTIRHEDQGPTPTPERPSLTVHGSERAPRKAVFKIPPSIHPREIHVNLWTAAEWELIPDRLRPADSCPFTDGGYRAQADILRDESEPESGADAGAIAEPKIVADAATDGDSFDC